MPREPSRETPRERTLLVVPCFNEAARLPRAQLAAGLAADPGLALLLVDDGSRDGTLAGLRALEGAHPGRVEVLALPENRGKAEAVRAGMTAALAGPARWVGYWDADLATPLCVVADFRARLEADPDLHLVLGSRVKRLGGDIQRSALRHYVGRVVATLASRFLRLPVYDTQCGAKLFRASPLAAEVFGRPFLSRWLFDVEVFARLQALAAAGRLPPVTRSAYEVPLPRWTDEPGSKVRMRDFFLALRDLRRMRRAYPAATRGLGQGGARP